MASKDERYFGARAKFVSAGASAHCSAELVAGWSATVNWSNFIIAGGFAISA